MCRSRVLGAFVLTASLVACGSDGNRTTTDDGTTVIDDVPASTVGPTDLAPDENRPTHSTEPETEPTDGEIETDPPLEGTDGDGETEETDGDHDRFEHLRPTMRVDELYSVRTFGDGDWYNGIEVADVDGDGRPEIIAGNSSYSRLEIWADDSAPGLGLTKVDEVRLANGIHDVAAGDIDEDGDLDLVAGATTSGLVAIHHLGFAYPDTWPRVWYPGQIDPAYSSQVIVEDFDGDGHLDIFDGNDSSYATTFYGLGNGMFVPGPGPEVAQDNRRAMAHNAVDLDGDGRLDVLGLDGADGPSYLRAFVNRSRPGEPEWSNDLGFAFVPSNLVEVLNNGAPTAGDVNGDGHVDLVVVEPHLPGTLLDPTDIVLFEGGETDGTLAWTERVVDTMAGQQRVAVVADVDGDSSLDIIVTGDDPTITLYLGNDDGTFAKTVVATERPLGSRHHVNSLTVTDVDGDGQHDIIAAQATENGSSEGGFVVLTTSPQHDVIEDLDDPSLSDAETDFGFIVAIEPTAEGDLMTYDRVDVTDYSFYRKVGAGLTWAILFGDAVNEHPRQRSLLLHDDARITLLCNGLDDVGPEDCPFTSPIPDLEHHYLGTSDDLVAMLDAVPYAWDAAVTEIPKRASFPALFRFEVVDGAVVDLAQHSLASPPAAGWSYDLGGWPLLWSPACCGGENRGTSSASLPTPDQPLPASLYGVDPWDTRPGAPTVTWDPADPSRLTLPISRWQCDDDGLCQLDSETVSYTVRLDARTIVHVSAYECVGEGEHAGPSSWEYLGDGNALQTLLLDLERDLERWVRAPLRNGLSEEEMQNGWQTSGDAPFARFACGHGEAQVYRHTASGLELLLQHRLLADTSVAQLLSVTSAMGSTDGTTHLFAIASYIP